MTFKTPDIWYVMADAEFGPFDGTVFTEWELAARFYGTIAPKTPARVFALEMDADNRPASFTDVTHEVREYLLKGMGIEGYDAGDLDSMIGEDE